MRIFPLKLLSLVSQVSILGLSRTSLQVIANEELLNGPVLGLRRPGSSPDDEAGPLSQNEEPLSGILSHNPESPALIEPGTHSPQPFKSNVNPGSCEPGSSIPKKPMKLRISLVGMATKSIAVLFAECISNLEQRFLSKGPKPKPKIAASLSAMKEAYEKYVSNARLEANEMMAHPLLPNSGRPSSASDYHASNFILKWNEMNKAIKPTKDYIDETMQGIMVLFLRLSQRNGLNPPPWLMKVLNEGEGKYPVMQLIIPEVFPKRRSMQHFWAKFDLQLELLNSPRTQPLHGLLKLFDENSWQEIQLKYLKAAIQLFFPNKSKPSQQTCRPYMEEFITKSWNSKREHQPTLHSESTKELLDKILSHSAEIEAKSISEVLEIKLIIDMTNFIIGKHVDSPLTEKINSNTGYLRLKLFENAFELMSSTVNMEWLISGRLYELAKESTYPIHGLDFPYHTAQSRSSTNLVSLDVADQVRQNLEKHEFMLTAIRAKSQYHAAYGSEMWASLLGAARETACYRYAYPVVSTSKAENSSIAKRGKTTMLNTSQRNWEKSVDECSTERRRYDESLENLRRARQEETAWSQSSVILASFVTYYELIQDLRVLVEETDPRKGPKPQYFSDSPSEIVTANQLLLLQKNLREDTTTGDAAPKLATYDSSDASSKKRKLPEPDDPEKRTDDIALKAFKATSAHVGAVDPAREQSELERAVDRARRVKITGAASGQNASDKISPLHIISIDSDGNQRYEGQLQDIHQLNEAVEKRTSAEATTSTDPSNTSSHSREPENQEKILDEKLQSLGRSPQGAYHLEHNLHELIGKPAPDPFEKFTSLPVVPLSLLHEMEKDTMSLLSKHFNQFGYQSVHEANSRLEILKFIKKSFKYIDKKSVVAFIKHSDYGEST